MQNGDWDYPCEMFSTSVKMVPDNLMFRQLLRACQRKKYKDNKSGQAKSSVKVASIRWKIDKARTDKNWVEMDAAAEEGLAINPWDRQFNSDLGEATRESGFTEISAWAYETATRAE